MLDERYVIRGLDALSRAQSTDYFADGHKGAAILSAYYLCSENAVEQGAQKTIANMIDANWTHTDLCAPFLQERADAALLDRIVAALDKNIDRLRQVGHNVIFPSLALKTFRQFPDAITPSRVDGICKLIQAFNTSEDITLDENDDIHDLDTPWSAAEFALREMLRAADAFLGRGQGWTGHLLTYGRALIDLHQLGYTDLAAKGYYAFKLYIKRVRMGPLETDKHIAEHPPSEHRPLERSYWERRKQQDIGIGHCFKYPYGFYGLMELASDPGLKQKCLGQAYHVF